jgi:ribonuclease-3
MVMNYIQSIEAAIGYEFQDVSLLERALHHSSLNNAPSNERLEFLGDRVLGLVLAHLLYRDNRLENEGDMARYFNQLARKETCAAVAVSIGLGEAMVLSRGERHTGGNRKVTILADACEALLAAVFLDSTWEGVQRVVERLWKPHIDSLTYEQSIDSKTRLQEWAQAQGLGLPLYEIVGRKGPDHEPIFLIQVSIGKFPPLVAEGSSRRMGEREVATLFLKHYTTR